MIADVGMDIPVTDDGNHFYLKYHPKGVCNRHCDRHKSHRKVLQEEFAWFAEFCDRFCGTDVQPPDINNLV